MRPNDWSQFPRRRLRVLKNIELKILLGMAAVWGGIWLFLELADEVLEQETRHVDEWILLSMRSAGDYADPLGPRWLEEMGRDFTALGGTAVLGLLTLCACLYLLLLGRRKWAGFTVSAISSGWVIGHLLKMIYARPRPDLVPHSVFVDTASFPSGHAMMAAVTYLTLAALLTRAAASWRLRFFFFMTAVFFTVLVGVSRIYLGVHWPSDVLAGWTVGATWAGLCWLATGWLQRRGLLERPGLQTDHGV